MGVQMHLTRGISSNLQADMIVLKPFLSLRCTRLNYVSLLFDVQYQMLHVCPPHRPTPVIAKNKELSDATGFLNVHKDTLQHVKYSNIFGIGDCTTLPTSKTAAAVGMETGNFFHLLKIIGLEELRETTKTSVRIVVPKLRFESGTSGIKKKVCYPFECNVQFETAA